MVGLLVARQLDPASPPTESPRSAVAAATPSVSLTPREVEQTIPSEQTEPRIGDVAPPPVWPTPEAVRDVATFPDALATAVALSVEPTPALVDLVTPTPAVSDAPAIEALRELQAIGQAAPGRLAGVVSRAPRPDSGGSFRAPTPTPARDDILERVGGQARGFTMLPLMHPRARPMVEAQIDTLLKAQIQQVYLGVLADGTFSLDLDYLNAVIERLNAGGRELTLVLYFSSGPTMRDWETTPIRTPFSTIDPRDFRNLIRSDAWTRRTFEATVRRMVPALQLNRSLKPTNRSIAIVMLEDNLERESYRAMRALMQGVIGPDIEVMRNPCPGCRPGNDADTLGDPIEIHAPADSSRLGRRDGFTMDGAGYIFPGERRTPPREYSIDETINLIDEVTAQGASFFGLWRARRQGIVEGELPHPDLRTYEVPTPQQSEVEIELLRHGLLPFGSAENEG